MKMGLDALQQSAIWELQQAVQREEMPLGEIPLRDRLFTVEYWLERCIKEYRLGNHPGVQELYQKRFGKPVPQEYL